MPSFWSLIFSNIELQRLGRAAYCLQWTLALNGLVYCQTGRYPTAD